MASLPSDADLTAAIRDILHVQAQASEGLAGLSRKVLRQHLEARFGCDLAPLKDTIKATVEHLLTTDPALQEEGEDDAEEVDEATAGASMEESDHDDADMDDDFKPRRAGGFHMPYALSPALAAVVGPEPRARGQVVKALWNYIKDRGLQDEADRRYVLCDAPLKALFDGADRVSGFGMQKILSAHLFKLDTDGNPTQESPKSKAKTKSPKTKSPKTTPAKRGRPATRGAAAAAKKAKSESSTTEKRGSGFTVPRKLSPQLAAVVGTDVLGRPMAVKKLWEYIKQHDLQDPADRRYILCDKQLREVLGVDRVSSFGMQKLLSPHIGERVDVPGGAAGADEQHDNDDE
ncbi:hypothetical protein AMAG_16060 [Allomyces macrogynus ATCC 38327]|uniref:DM2 domain-containing protein n=1 Tax=Allomyces macrogynus (strain ATCC 38327) TaxID=578462 RepID=A0A0L0TAM6_ALLM3|nr:hypothetical protein, variant [Allomyces macrogynus ATCC 38327]KNE71755.1 hypothetical protein AMAG_16060 [Allomyces macrogynus ATCC 38327]|eukprot:KNE71754.1 hypothetical protein, variant [Allomyces macrogynus ATCC 38327]